MTRYAGIVVAFAELVDDDEIVQRYLDAATDWPEVSDAEALDLRSLDWLDDRIGPTGWPVLGQKPD